MIGVSVVVSIETETEGFCCRDTNEVPDEFKGYKYITESDDFQMVSLVEPGRRVNLKEFL